MNFALPFVNQTFGGNDMKRRLTLIAVLASLAGCTFNVKPIYDSKEKAKAEATVVQFHSLYNERKFDEIYERLDKQATQSREQFMAATSDIASHWGKLQTTRLDEAKVFYTSPIQVKMIYNSTFEKGNAQEWFTWNIYGEEVRLFEYNLTAGWDK